MESQIDAEFKEYNDLHCEIGALFHDAAQRVGLSDSVMNILYTVTTYGVECTQSNICKLTGISRQTINSAIRKLEKDGILFLQGGRKNKAICLTEHGRCLVAEKVIPVVEAEKAALASWTPEERKILLYLTRKYVEDFKKNLDEEEDK